MIDDPVHHCPCRRWRMGNHCVESKHQLLSQNSSKIRQHLGCRKPEEYEIKYKIASSVSNKLALKIL